MQKTNRRSIDRRHPRKSQLVKQAVPTTPTLRERSRDAAAAASALLAVYRVLMGCQMHRRVAGRGILIGLRLAAVAVAAVVPMWRVLGES